MTDSYIVQSGEVIQSLIVQSGVVSVEIQSPATDVVLVGGPQGPQGATGPPGSTVTAALITQAILGDGTTEDFELDVPASSDLSVQVFRNGLAEIAGVGFTTSSSGGTTVVSFSNVPLANDEVQVVYQI